MEVTIWRGDSGTKLTSDIDGGPLRIEVDGKTVYDSEDENDGPDEDGERLVDDDDVDEEPEDEETTERDQDEMCERAAREYESSRLMDPRE